MRKMARRNERSLYKRRCDLCQKEMISMYQTSAPYRVYCNDCWWSDQWDPLAYGREYDPQKPFLLQFQELTREVPRPALYQKGCVGSPYTNHTDHVKNCYLAINCGFWKTVFTVSGALSLAI